MNYLAHGYRFLDDRFRLAGTALPDWLGAVQRRTRVPARLARQFVDLQDQEMKSFALGILQHHEDDAHFHAGPTFNRLCSEFNQRIKTTGEEVNDHVRALTVHIVIELLLDASLAVEFPSLLDDYYEAMHAIDAHRVSGLVTTMTGHPTSDLSTFIAVFRREAFLRDYSDDEQLMKRLSQIYHRIRLGLPPRSIHELIGPMRACVHESMNRLLRGT